MHDDTHLEHKFHHELPSKANVLAAADLSDSEEAWVEQMYDVGLSSGTTAGVMTGYFDKKGKKGQFNATGSKHITSKHRKEVELLSGTESDMSQAEKTIRILNE